MAETIPARNDRRSRPAAYRNRDASGSMSCGTRRRGLRERDVVRGGGSDLARGFAIGTAPLRSPTGQVRSSADLEGTSAGKDLQR
jgi:hypothetical protein